EGKHNTESDHPENEYLEILYDEGIVGFGVFIWLLGVFIIGGFKAMNVFSGRDAPSKNPDSRAYYMWGLLAGLAGMLAHNAVCVSLRFVSSGVILWFIIGALGALIIHNPLPEQSPGLLWPQNNPIPRVLRRGMQLAIVISAVWAINIFSGFFMADIYHNIAISFSKQGRWPDALTFYNKVTHNNFGFIMTHYFMGNVYNDRFNLNRDFHPEWGDKKNDEPWSGILNNVKGRVDPERSISKYEDVWTLAPNYVQSYHQAGLVHLKLGDYYRQTGDMARARKEWDRAIYKFERYHAIDPIFAQNYYRMAWIYIQKGEYDKAEETYWRHIYTYKDIFRPGADEKEWVSAKMGRLAASVPDWCEAHKGAYHSFAPEDWGLRRAAEHSETYMNMGNLKYLERNFPKAEEYYLKASEMSPENVQILKNLAALYNQQGRSSAAFDILRRIKAVAPNDPSVSALPPATR
ncbi:MAG: tetratricopeptide repeat protein, partial [Endomicrobiia bacterium]|nr:tetratricopeptide repeat protein [Endomicrobiia bacterium]